ncbi:MAG: PSD1 domain-containing protein [Acidobacteria bacterium]|nr:PSD1 domain-containing protein [Acidobacteriota bacterium]
MRIITGIVLLLSGAASGQVPTFQHDILPLFERRCNTCHGSTKTANLDMRTLPSLLTGGASGPVVVPGKPEHSVLWKKIASDAMPLGGKQLTAVEKELVRKWIETGQFPGARSESLPEGQFSERARRFWSYQKPVSRTPPAVKNRAEVRSPIDAFLLEKLEAKGLSLNQEAPREKLIRRAYYDLTGLPPSPEDVRSFIQDKSEGAYEALIDRLLKSERYGERWARHWLDAAGYADGNGFLGDEPRTHAWRYRDWVIRALNGDMPYDQFLTEQFAGDQMVDWKMGEPLSPEAVEKLTATGFLRLTPDGTDNQTIYEVDKQYDALHAATEVSMKALMGISLGCARCHDHKFDPILQKDYYRIMAAIRPVYDPDDVFPPKDSKWLAANIGSGEWPARLVPNATKEQMDAYLQVQKELAKTRPPILLMAAAREKWLTAQLEKLDEPQRSEALAAVRTPESKRSDNQKRLMRGYSDRFSVSDQELEKFDPALKQARESQSAIAAKLKAVRPEMIWAAWDVSPNATTRVLLRGDFESPSDVVEPGVPLILDDPKNPFQPAKPTPGSPHTGRRLAFAKWLTKPDHPLTSRVIVNRIWQHHFGSGIVATPDDFGSQGARPTHPELLDWLAVSLVEHGWKLKWLHKEIMMSAAYRQSSSASPAQLKADEPNRLLSRWPARRLEAEAVRDGILAASGLLSLELYGDPIALCTAPDGNYLPDTAGRIDGERIRGFNFDPPPCKPAAHPLPAGRNPNRRSIYLQVRRVAAPGFLVAYDAPLMDNNVAMRFRSSVPTQALAALHNPLMVDAASALAERTKTDAGADLVARIRRALELAYSRPAGENEVSFAFAQISRQKDAESGLRMFCQALMGSNDFLYVD